MKISRLLSPLIILIAVLVYISCTKTDQQPEASTSATKERRFFNDNTSKNEIIKNATEFVQRQNSKYRFVENIINQIGYPQWDKSLVFSSLKGTLGRNAIDDSTNVVFIPFVRDSQNVVNASLRISMSPTDTTFKFLCDWQYIDSTATGLNGRHQSLLLMALDKSVFGDNLFKVTDSLAFPRFGESVKYVSINSAANNRNSALPITGRISLLEVIYTISVCYTYYVPLHQGQLVGCPPGPDCPLYTQQTSCESISWTEYEYDEGGGSGGTGGTGGTGGVGGGEGSGGGWNPPQCPGGTVRGSTYENCTPGWEPGGGGGSPSPSEPVDSILARYSRAIKDTAIYIYDHLSQPYNIEYALTGTLQNGQIVPIEIRTNNDSLQVIPKVMIERITLLFIWHSHVSRSSDPRERGSFSPDDIEMLRNVRCLTQGFVSFAECRDKRYALVITDVAKASSFFTNNSYEQIFSNYTALYSSNTQQYQENCIKNVISSSAANGIALYVSSDAPNFQTWTILNP